jgi:hypothetical protein
MAAQPSSTRPDGHMGDYLASLDKLVLASQQWEVPFILPAHGYVLGNLWGEPYSAVLDVYSA